MELVVSRYAHARNDSSSSTSELKGCLTECRPPSVGLPPICPLSSSLHMSLKEEEGVHTVRHTHITVYRGCSPFNSLGCFVVIAAAVRRRARRGDGKH